jgi:hypothetical protein
MPQAENLIRVSRVRGQWNPRGYQSSRVGPVAEPDFPARHRRTGSHLEFGKPLRMLMISSVHLQVR